MRLDDNDLTRNMLPNKPFGKRRGKLKMPYLDDIEEDLATIVIKAWRQ